MAGFGVVGSAHDADHLGAHAGIPLTGHDTVGHGLDHTGRLEPVRFGHEPGAEAKFDVVDPFPAGIHDVFVGHPPAGIQVVQNSRQPPESPDEVHQAIRLAVHDDVRPQRLEVGAGQLDTLFPGDLQHGFQPNGAVQVAVQVDQR